MSVTLLRTVKSFGVMPSAAMAFWTSVSFEAIVAMWVGLTSFRTCSMSFCVEEVLSGLQTLC
jgi:hypothetical protein